MPEYENRILAAVERGDGQVQPFVVLRTSATSRQQLLCARQFDSARPIPGAHPFAPRERTGRKQLRVGYLSSDFHDHATAYLIAGMIEMHDRNRFGIFGYSYGTNRTGETRQRLAQSFDAFSDIHDLSLLASAQKIYDDEIDILVDLKGYTTDTRSQILSFRPAPVQVAYLGYPGTMGVPYIDYAMADPYLVPPGAEHDFSEKIVYLPGSYQINDRKRSFAEQRPEPSEYGLPEGCTILCSFNASYKITPEVFSVWMRLLRAVPDAVIWILEDQPDAIENLTREASACGVSPVRLIFAERLPLESHLRRLRIADLMLDTFPVNAHTTASDALWSGCPVLTCSGETFVSRVAGSLLHAAGLPELITHSFEDYEAKALHLISHPDELRRLRSLLEANRLTCSLFNSKQTTRHLESAFESMWQIYCDGGAPRTFSVPRCIP